MIHIKLTLHEFIGENMQAGISNMEDIHDLMLWSDIFGFRVHKTTVLIQKASFFKCAQRIEVHAFWKSRLKISQNHTSNLDKVFLELPPSSDFGLEARILQIGWFYRPKWKKVKKSASKNKHPIKLRFFTWRLESVNPEKKVILENQVFRSCPFKFF